MPDLENISTRAWAELNSNALINNIKRAKQGSTAKAMAVIKANAYGHELKFVANTLVDYADGFAIATLQEGIALRALHPNIPIVCLSGFYDSNQIALFLDNKILPVIFNLEQIKWLEAAGPLDLDVWLKIDTGMGRLGISPNVVPTALKRLQNIGCKVNIMSHLASADTPLNNQNNLQHDQFTEATKSLPQNRSFCNSAAILSRPQDHFEFIRPGIMLYGSSPFNNQSAQKLGLKAVMCLYARLIEIKQIKAGEPVGYGGIWQATKNTTIGIVSIGYGDGYPRLVSSKAQVYLHGRRYSIIGRVSMDSLAIKLDNAQAQIGDHVELWGDNISVDEVANWAGTISYELLCKITSRVERIYQ